MDKPALDVTTLTLELTVEDSYSFVVRVPELSMAWIEDLERQQIRWLTFCCSALRTLQRGEAACADCGEEVAAVHFGSFSPTAYRYSAWLETVTDPLTAFVLFRVLTERLDAIRSSWHRQRVRGSSGALFDEDSSRRALEEICENFSGTF